MSINLNLNSNYYGVTSFNSIAGSSQKSSALSAIYSAGSQASQLGALTSAIGTLKSASAGLTGDEKAAVTAKIAKITTAMKNSFSTADTSVYTSTDTRSVNELAKEKASAMLSKYNSGTSIDKLI